MLGESTSFEETKPPTLSGFKLSPFVITASLGGVLILITNWYLLDSADQASSTGFDHVVQLLPPMAVMIGYWLFLRRSIMFRSNKELQGDYIYYLGFTFTLISLCATTILVLEPSRESLSISTMLGNFGIALVTTIAGICARLASQEQGPQDVFSLDDDLKQRFSWGQHQLAKEIDTTLAELSKVRAEALSELDKIRAEAARAITDMSEIETSKKFAKDLDKATSEVVTKVKAIAESLNKLESSLQFESEAPKSLEALLGGLEDSIASSKDGLSQFKAVSDASSEMLSGLAASSKTTKEVFATLQADTRRWSEQLEQEHKVLDENRRKIEQILTMTNESTLSLYEAMKELASELRRSATGR